MFISNKTKIIIEREYLSRIKKKSFWILTFLMPFLILGFGVLIGLVTSSSKNENKIAYTYTQNVGYYKLQNTDNLNFNFLPYDTFINLKNQKEFKDYNAFLLLTDSNATLYAESSLGAFANENIKEQLSTLQLNYLLTKNNINIEEINKIKNEVHINLNEKIGKDEKESFTSVATGVAMAGGFIMYMLILLNGINVMRSVSEEKTNKVIEVLISSVKPKEIMTGKLIGVCLVGITQLLLWIVLLGIIIMMIPAFMPKEFLDQAQNANTTSVNASEINNVINLSIIQSINWFKIILTFMGCFMGGYLLYSSLFAAVGNLVSSDAQESQSFTMPITLPIIFSISLITPIATNPNGTLALILSLFPLTSPILLLARAPFDIPYWQIFLSFAIMLFTIIFVIRFSSLLYKAGVFYTGNKVKLKDIPKLLKWQKSL